MNVHDAPIGLFDSGLGGLSVALEVRRLLPAERLLYAADSRYCPYGSRMPEEIRWRSELIASALVQRGIKLLIIACNTATAYALEDLRSSFPIPIIGLEPAVKPAVELSRSGRIGVLATPRTAASDRLRRLIDRYGRDVRVYRVPAPGLVELVEAGAMEDERAHAAVTPLIDPLLHDGVDTIVLGCTHYPFLRNAIQYVAGDQVQLIDSGEAIARRACALLETHDAHALNDRAGGLELLTTGDVEQVSVVAGRLLAENFKVEYLSLPDGPHGYEPPADADPKFWAACTTSASAGA